MTSSNPSSEDKFASGPQVAELGIKDRVTTKEEPSFTTWERAMKGSLADMTREVAREVLLVWDAPVGVTSFCGVGVSVEIGADSPLKDLSAWVLSLVGIGLNGGIRVLARAPNVVAVEVEAIASVTATAPSKKPSIGALAVVGASSLVG